MTCCCLWMWWRTSCTVWNRKNTPGETNLATKYIREKCVQTSRWESFKWYMSSCLPLLLLFACNSLVNAPALSVVSAAAPALSGSSAGRRHYCFCCRTGTAISVATPALCSLLGRPFSAFFETIVLCSKGGLETAF